MKIFRSLAVATFIAGLVFLVVGFAFAGGGDDKQQVDGFTPVAATPTEATAEPSSTSTSEPSATATPAPFDGQIAVMKIPRFDVNSKIEAIGLLPNNQLDTPHDPHNTGWYKIYDKPGFGGNAVFSAHVDYYPNILGPFNKLFQSQIGDDISVVMENGLEYKYRVIRKERYDVATIPMGELIWPSNRPAGNEWITLITCGGRFLPTQASGAGEYLDRDVVVAERYQ